MAQSLIGRNSRWAALFMLFLALLDPLLYILFEANVAAGLDAFRQRLREASWADLALHAAGILLAVWLLIDRRPKLCVDARGIFWSPIGDEPIPWSAIREIRIPYGVSQTSFHVVLTHSDAVPGRRSGLRRLQLGRESGNLIKITLDGLNPGIDVAIDTIDRFKPGLIRRVE